MQAEGKLPPARLSMTPERKAPSPSHAPERTRLVWGDGHLWAVVEIAAPSFDRRGGTHLLFYCDEIMRRIRDFPPNWVELDDAALYALSTAPPRRR